MKYQYIQDPGHGWVGVPEAELIELGITGDITFYSYMGSDRVVWLEEDCDLSTWLDAKLSLTKLPNGRLDDASRSRASKWFEENIESEYADRTPIHNMKAYNGGWKRRLSTTRSNATPELVPTR